MVVRAGLVVAAVVSAAIGVHSFSPRQLYNEMYPVETLKRDVFNICRDADSTFIRAVRTDRERCFDSMPRLIGIALGRIRPVLSMAALFEQTRQAELLMTLASMPPRQPIVVPRSFANTGLTRPTPASCDDGPAPTSATGSPVPAPGTKEAELGATIQRNLPVAQPPGAAPPGTLPTIPLAGAGPSPTPTPAAAPEKPFAALAAPDVGDNGPPAIVPLPPGCSGRV
jgi:hypothetical protein